MNDASKLTLLTSLIRTFFSDDLQFDETPAGAKKRMQLRLAILELSEDPYAAQARKEAWPVRQLNLQSTHETNQLHLPQSLQSTYGDPRL